MGSVAGGGSGGAGGGENDHCNNSAKQRPLSTAKRGVPGDHRASDHPILYGSCEGLSRHSGPKSRHRAPSGLFCGPSCLFCGPSCPIRGPCCRTLTRRAGVSRGPRHRSRSRPGGRSARRRRPHRAAHTFGRRQRALASPSAARAAVRDRRRACRPRGLLLAARPPVDGVGDSARGQEPPGRRVNACCARVEVQQRGTTAPADHAGERVGHRELVSIQADLAYLGIPRSGGGLPMRACGEGMVSGAWQTWQTYSPLRLCRKGDSPPAALYMVEKKQFSLRGGGEVCQVCQRTKKGHECHLSLADLRKP